MDRVRELCRGEEHSSARALGGLLLAIGVLVVLFRRTELNDPWGDLPVFLVLLVTTTFLFGVGVLGARWLGRALPWHGAFVVFGLALIPFTLFSFLNLVDASTDAPLNTAWVFLVTAVAGFAAALIAHVRVGLLLGALALIIAWLALWDAILSDGIGADIGTLRGLLVLIALILLGVAAAVSTRDATEGASADVVTAAGIAAVLAGALSLGALAGSFFVFASPAVESSVLWDVELLVVTLALLIYGGASGRRGPAYVGVIGLIVFVYVVGFDADDDTPSGSLLGWPLLLVVAGAALLVFSALPALRRERT